MEDAPPALDARVLGIRKTSRRFPAARRILAVASRARKGLWVAAVVGFVFLIVVTDAIPQTAKLLSPPAPPPYTVDSEYVRYADDGSQAVEMLARSFTDQNGNEVILERTVPDRPLGTAAARTLDAILPLLRRLTAPLTVPAKELEKIKQHAPKTLGIVSGCTEKTCLLLEHWAFERAESGPSAPCAVGSLVGHATILSHSTIGIERPLPNPRATPSRPAAARITMWMAPDLGCFALRLSVEEQRPDGTFRLVSEKQALRVTLKQ